MDPASCRVIYIDDRFPIEKWLTRDSATSTTTTNDRVNQALWMDLVELPPDLQANVNALVYVFNQVFVCNSGRSFSAKLAEIHDSVKSDCSPILALFDVDSDSKHDHLHMLGAQKSKSLIPPDPPRPSQPVFKRQLTFSSETDESYGLHLLSRIASDLQVDEGVKLVLPIALVRTKRKDSTTTPLAPNRNSYSGREPLLPPTIDGRPSPIDSQMMLHCLDAGALDVIPSPLNNERIMGLTVHAYRIYKLAKKEQSAFLASASNFIAAAKKRKQSWVGIEEEKPYAYLREAMVKKLLKGICEPEAFIEDYQNRHLRISDDRRQAVVEEIGKWSFCAHDFSEDELVFAGYFMLDHALQMPELEHWRMNQDEILRFMQASRIAYNSFVLYHNFRHAVDVLQSLFYFLVQIGSIPPYPVGSAPPPHSQEKSPIAQLLKPFEALTLLISAIGHDVGHPGVNNMFLVKLNAPLAQLYNDQSVLEAFHCASYSQILRRHWPSVFADKALRKLLISSILATDMGVHSDYMQQLGKVQERIHESNTTDSWNPKDIDSVRILMCGLLIKCADISNVARPWTVAERWTYLLQQEFASQGEMENQVGMETTLFGGPPEIGNVMKLANGQIGFMGIFAHPLFANMTDIIPAMGFAAAEIMNNKSIWMTRVEREKRKEHLKNLGSPYDGSVSPRSENPPAPVSSDKFHTSQPPSTEYFPTTALRDTVSNPPSPMKEHNKDCHDPPTTSTSQEVRSDDITRNNSEAPSWKLPFVENSDRAIHDIVTAPNEITSTSSGAFPSAQSQSEAQRPQVQTRKSSNTVPRSLQINGPSEAHDQSITSTRTSSDQGVDEERRKSEHRKSDYTPSSLSLLYDDSVPDLPSQQAIPEEEVTKTESFPSPEHNTSVSKHCSFPHRPFSHPPNQSRTLGPMSIRSSTERNSVATSGGQTYSTNYSTALSPSTEATSFLTLESSEEHIDDREHEHENLTCPEDPYYYREKTRPSSLPEVVPYSTTGHAPPPMMRGGDKTKSSMKTSTAMVKEPGQETLSSWDEGDGDKSIRRRISRLRFWKKRSDEDDRL